MATGFAVDSTSTNYMTLFQRIRLLAGNEKKSVGWYKSAVIQEASKYGKDLRKFALDEKRDRIQQSELEDQNMLRRYPVAGHIYMFEYKAKMKWLPYYDRFPLVYVIKSNRTEFWGANLHYMQPKRRLIAIKKLRQGMIDMPKACFHKYLNNHVEGLYLDLASTEWQTAVLLPTEDFVKDVQGHVFPYDKKDVWDEVDENRYDSIKARRIIYGYGNKLSKEKSR